MRLSTATSTPGKTSLSPPTSRRPMRRDNRALYRYGSDCLPWAVRGREGRSRQNPQGRPGDTRMMGGPALLGRSGAGSGGGGGAANAAPPPLEPDRAGCSRTETGRYARFPKKTAGEARRRFGFESHPPHQFYLAGTF
ncbi:hypothetical protein JOC24_006498 [Streptomyces sp. HB132]|nr:hypothetical protein [Streptomyces sp. HB132]